MAILLGFITMGLMSVLGMIADRGRAQVAWVVIGAVTFMMFGVIMSIGQAAIESEDKAVKARAVAVAVAEAEFRARPLCWDHPATVSH